MLKKIFIIAVLSIFLLSCNKVAEPVTVQSGLIEVSVDPRVELMGIVCYLAGYEEYSAYIKFLDYHTVRSINDNFLKWKNHKVVRLMMEYRFQNAMGYNAPMSMAIHLSNDKLEPLVPLEPFPVRLDSRWKDIDINEFAKALKDFRKVTGFDTFFENNRKKYKGTIVKTKTLILKKNVPIWLLNFFGENDRVKHSLIVSHFVGWYNYGCSMKNKDILHITPVVGTGYDDEYSEIIVHEFSHEYGNYLIEKIWREISPVVDNYSKSVPDELVKIGYGISMIYMYETLVRSTTGVFVKDKMHSERYDDYMDEQTSKSFNWVPGLTELFIDEYQNNRDIYPDLDSFSSRIVDFVLAQDVDTGLAK